MIKNRISSYLYKELFSESNDKICTTFQSMVWSVVAHKNTIKNCSTSLQAFPFRSLSLYPLPEAVNYYHKAFHLGCCSSPRSASASFPFS